jgi:FixJ family two-component response regulator
MDKTTLTNAQRQIRMNIRNFLLVATIAELETEIEISNRTGDTFRAACVQELLDQAVAEETEAAYSQMVDGKL